MTEQTNVVHPTSDETFNSDVTAYPGVCVVKFYKDNCQPCRAIKGNYIYEARQFGDRLKFYEYDGLTNSEVAGRLGVGGWPQPIFFKNGRIVHRYEGAPHNLSLTPIIAAGLLAK